MQVLSKNQYDDLCDADVNADRFESVLGAMRIVQAQQSHTLSLLSCIHCVSSDKTAALSAYPVSRISCPAWRSR